MTTPREVFTAFLTQACCGTIVALHRMGNTEIVTYKEQLVFMLTGYFNNCWNFLLSGGDAYVVESFEMMKHDNPSCVIRHLFSIGASILPDEPPLEIVCVTPDNVEALEAARMAISKTLHQLIMDSTTDELFLHTCEGLSLNEERAIWVEKGRPTVAFFEHEVQCPPTECISKIRFSPQGCPMTLLGATSWDKSCRVWQIENGLGGMNISSKPMSLIMSDAPILDLSFSTDGRVFYGGCNKTASMWNLVTGQSSVVATHDLPVSCLSYVCSPAGGDMLITGSWDGRLRFWDMKQPRPLKEEVLGEPIFALDAQKSFPMAACVTGRKVHVFNLQTLTKVNELKPHSMVKFNLRCVACSPQHDGVAIGSSEGRVSFISLQQESGCTFKAHALFEDNVFYMHQTNFCVVDSKTSRIISGGGDGRIAFWDYKKKCNISYESEAKIPNRNNSISAGDASADFSLLAYGRSYDWALGKTRAIANEPHSIYVCPINGKQVRS